MAQPEKLKLDKGSAFPEIVVQFFNGSTATITKDFEVRWVVFLVYRGHW